MHRLIRRTLPIAAALVASTLSTTAHANVAKFTVMPDKTKVEGGKASVTVAWEYNNGGNASLTGNDVKFFASANELRYKKAATGTEIGTVDMTKGGKGTHTFTVDVAALGLQEGATTLHLAARWPNGHEWGSKSDSRPGGEVILPEPYKKQAGQGLARIEPVNPKTRRAEATRSQRAAGLAAPKPGRGIPQTDSRQTRLERRARPATARSRMRAKPGPGQHGRAGGTPRSKAPKARVR